MDRILSASMLAVVLVLIPASSVLSTQFEYGLSQYIAQLGGTALPIFRQAITVPNYFNLKKSAR
jgi:hypothetical protein